MTLAMVNDEKSKRALEMLESGMRHIEISRETGLSLDRVKKLSRYRKMIEQAKGSLPDLAVEKLEMLGMNALALSDLLKSGDTGLLGEILMQVDENTSRSRLRNLPKELEARKAALESAKETAGNSMAELEKRALELERKTDEAARLEKKLKKDTAFLDGCNSEARDFLEDHIGVNGGDIVLLKRLYITWQSELRDDGVIEYDRRRKVWVVSDIETLKKSTELRIAGDERDRMHWDPYNVPWQFTQYRLPEKAEYHYAGDIAAALKTSISRRRREIEELKKEKRAIRENIRSLKKKAVTRFVDAKDYSNHFSELEIIRHGVLEHEAMKWLYAQGYAAANEIVLPDGKRVDVAGFSMESHVVAVEAKASMVDFMGDRKWKSYLANSNELYFIFGSWDNNIEKIRKRIGGSGAGILVFDEVKKAVNVSEKAAARDMDSEDAQEMSFKIAMRASVKNVKGF